MTPAVVDAEQAALQEARGELRQLRRELEQITLTHRQRREVDSALDAAESELAREAPEKRRVAGQLARLATVLRSAGEMPHPAAQLARRLERLGAWLGALVL
jgi:chromosome segregation ATPase